jgi:hypothetical protein
MNLKNAAIATLTSRRVWLWQIAGVFIYLIPVAIRFFTGSVAIPILNFPGFWIGHFIPGNFLEKLLINAFFPGGAGGILGETFAKEYHDEAPIGKTKYLSRLYGALLQTAVWSAFQYWGFTLMINGPYGSNLFEYVTVFPINFVLATVSIFTPDVVGFFNTRLRNAKQRSNSN